MPARGRRRLAARIQVLPSTPRPPGCEKLAGLDLYRVRHGDYRVVYEIADEALVVSSVRIDHGHDIGL